MIGVSFSGVSNFDRLTISIKFENSNYIRRERKSRKTLRTLNNLNRLIVNHFFNRLSIKILMPLQLTLNTANE